MNIHSLLARSIGVFILALLPATAASQELVILPSAALDDTFSLGEFVAIDAPDGTTPGPTLPLGAYLRLPDGSLLDVSDAAEWQVLDSEIALLESSNIVFSGLGSILVTVQFGNLQAVLPCHCLERMSGLGPEQAATTAILATESGAPVSRADLQAAAQQILDGLGRKGIPTSTLGTANANTPIVDDRDAFRNPITGGSRPITNSETGARYIPWGPSYIGNWPAWWVFATTDVIVVRPDFAEALVQQGEGVVHDHGLTNDAQVLLEEMIHQTIDEAGVQEQIGERAEEAIVKKMTTSIVPAMINIATILEKAELTGLDRSRLYQNLETIRNGLKTLRQENGDAAVDVFL